MVAGGTDEESWAKGFISNILYFLASLNCGLVLSKFSYFSYQRYNNTSVKLQEPRVY